MYLLFFGLRCKETFIWCLLDVVNGVFIHNTHVNIAVYTLCPHVPNQEVTLIFGVCRNHRWVIGWGCPGEQVPPDFHGATWVNDVVVSHVYGCEGLTGQVFHPIM